MTDRVKNQTITWQLQLRVQMLEEALVGAWAVIQGTVPEGQEDWYTENLADEVREIVARRPNLKAGGRG